MRQVLTINTQLPPRSHTHIRTSQLTIRTSQLTIQLRNRLLRMNQRTLRMLLMQGSHTNQRTRRITIPCQRRTRRHKRILPNKYDTRIFIRLIRANRRLYRILKTSNRRNQRTSNQVRKMTTPRPIPRTRRLINISPRHHRHLYINKSNRRVLNRN